MPASLQHESGNTYRVDVSGRLVKRELDAVQDAAAEEIRRVGPIRLLFVLTRFDGWEDGADWGDLRFYIRHERDIERIAIIGDDAWRSEALMFAGAELRAAPVMFFAPRALAEARAWLAGPDGPVARSSR